jgi:hypothetical protein
LDALFSWRFFTGPGSYGWGQSTENFFESNCFFGNHAAGEQSDPEKIMTDPLFVAPGTGGIGRNSVGGYKLRAGSPCLESGMDVPGHGERDYWGNKLYVAHSIAERSNF